MEDNKNIKPGETIKETTTQEVAPAEVKVPKAKTSDQVRRPNQDKKPFERKTGATPANRPGANRFGGPNKGGNNRRGNGPRRGNRRDTEFEERVVDIARVTNVVKGGRRFSFSALVVIGDKKGRVAYGHGKAKEVPEAIKKAIKDAKRQLIRVPIVKGGTIPHETQAKFISSNIMLKPAKKGKGIIASGAVRSVVELAGYHDIVTKSLGSSNKANSVKATIRALEKLRTVQAIAKLRDKEISHFK